MRTLAATVCVVLLAACASTGDDAGTDRAAEIRAARAVLGGAITDLGGAVVAVDEGVTGVRLGEPPTPDERREAIAELRDETLSELRAALDATADVAVDSDDPAVATAFESWQAAGAAAEELVDAAAADLDHTELLVEVDGTLAEIVTGWAVPGSYSQQVERFTDLADRARAPVTELQGVRARPSCSQSAQRRRDAARWAADSTEELRDLIERRRGEEFDARRQELTASVYGFEEVSGTAETVLARLDAGERDCWRGHGQTPAAVDRIDEAVDAIEDALNPDV